MSLLLPASTKNDENTSPIPFAIAVEGTHDRFLFARLKIDVVQAEIEPASCTKRM